MTCAQGDETQEGGASNSCRCSTKPFGLYGWQSAVASCDDPGSGSWACFYDVNTAGQSTSCLCYKYLCVSHGGECSCGYGIAPQGATLVDSCPATTTCCAATRAQPATANALQYLDECDCSSASSCGSGSVQVPSCTSTPPTQTTQPVNVASSCAGLHWAPPSSSGSDGG